MRTLSIILGALIAVAVPSVAGSSPSALPGPGVFSYSGPPASAEARPITPAAR